jgi:phage terminase small subunit
VWTFSQTCDAIVQKWSSRLGDYSRLEAHVKASVLIEELLADLRELKNAEPTVNLTEAALRTGYSADHLKIISELRT